MLFVLYLSNDFILISFFLQFLEKNNIVDMNRENFSFSSKVLLGDFLQPTVGEECVRLSEEQVMKRLEELKLSRSMKSQSGSHRSETLPLL